MRNKVAKIIRKESNKRGFTPRGYRYVKRKYNRLQPILEDILEDGEPTGKVRRVSVLTQKKRVLCPN